MSTRQMPRHGMSHVTLRTKIVEFPLSGEEWDTMVANSKFNDKCDFKRFGKMKSGKIGLQDHGNKVSFRNIKIRKL